MARLHLPSKPPFRLARAAAHPEVRPPPAPRRVLPVGAKVRLRRSFALAAALGVIALAWSSPLLLPLRLLVVAFHELGHVAVAVATGATVHEVALDLAEGGRTVTSGGSPLLILNGGYLGSLALGLLVLRALEVPAGARGAAAVLGSVLALISVLFFSSALVPYSALLVTAVALLGVATRAPEAAAEWVVRVIGWTSVLYALLDLRADALARVAAGGDAAQLERLTGLPAAGWGLTWLAVGLWMVYASRHRLV